MTPYRARWLPTQTAQPAVEKDAMSLPVNLYQQGNLSLKRPPKDFLLFPLAKVRFDALPK